MVASTGRSPNSSAGTYQSTPFQFWQAETLVKPSGSPTPHVSTIAGSPQAAPRSASSTSRCAWSAIRSGTAATYRLHADRMAASASGASTETAQPASTSSAAHAATPRTW